MQELQKMQKFIPTAVTRHRRRLFLQFLQFLHPHPRSNQMGRRVTSSTFPGSLTRAPAPRVHGSRRGARSLHLPAVRHHQGYPGRSEGGCGERAGRDHQGWQARHNHSPRAGARPRGRQMALKLPPYVHAFRDRHGKARYYFRRRGFRRAPLPGLPYSSEFMRAYEAAAQTVGEFGSSRSRPGTVAAAVAGYFASSAFASLAESTRKDRRRILERFRDHSGGNAIAALTRRDVEALVEARKCRPGTALNFLVALRALMRHAVLVGLVDRDPTEGVRGPKFRSDGFYTWTEQDIAAFEARHPVGSRARLALALGLYTGQRRSDVIRMGRQHVRDDVVHVRQQKTGRSLEIPIHPVLQAILEATPSNHLTFLTTQAGKPFSPAGFTNWFRDMCNKAGLLHGTSAHGLRKAACRRLAEAGCSANLIAAVSGHRSLREVQRYTEAVDQARMARSAMEKVTRTSSVKPSYEV